MALRRRRQKKIYSIDGVVRHILPKYFAIEFSPSIDYLSKRIINDTTNTISLVNVYMNSMRLGAICRPQHSGRRRPDVKMTAVVLVKIQLRSWCLIRIAVIKLIVKRFQWSRYELMGSDTIYRINRVLTYTSPRSFAFEQNLAFRPPTQCASRDLFAVYEFHSLALLYAVCFRLLQSCRFERIS